MRNYIHRPSAWLWLLLIAATVSFVSVPASAQNRRGGGATVYIDLNFGGEGATFRDDTPTLVPYGLNDQVSSIQIPRGETWEVCQDINYGYRCQLLSASVSDLRAIGWNDEISSLRRVREGFQGQRSGGVLSPSVTQRLTIFDRPGFRGASRTVTSQTSNLGFGGRGGSVAVQGGGTWELCDRTGRCATVSQNMPDLSALGLNGQITSVRLLNDQSYNRGNGRGYGRGRQDPNYGR